MAIWPHIQHGCSPRGSGGRFTPNIMQLALRNLCSAATLGSYTQGENVKQLVAASLSRIRCLRNAYIGFNFCPSLPPKS